MPIQATGYAAQSAADKLAPTSIERRDVGPKDVRIDVMFCGVCHSDVHQVKNEWMNTVYPCMPGHEIVGRVAEAGAESGFREGEIVGVGCMIDSCRQCEPCKSGEENYCAGPNSWLATYNGPMKPKDEAGENIYGVDNTFGGYSNTVVVDRHFVLRVPEGLKPEQAAPILCAGVTTFSPLRHAGVKDGSKVGVVGLGGLGHMAVKLAKALGAEVTVFTSSKEKLEEAKRLGADQAFLEHDKPSLEPLEASLDFILTTVPESHDVNPFVKLLGKEGKLVIVGALDVMAGVDNMEAASMRRSVSGSLIGSIKETQEVLDFCAEKGVAPEVEVIPIDQINDAFEKVERGEVRFRYVIDMSTLQAAA